MPFGLWTRVGQKHHVLGGVHNGATWRIPLNRPVRRRCGLFVKLLWKLAIAKPTFECDDIRISESMDQFLSEIQTSCFTQVTNVTFEHNFSVSQLIVLRSFTGGGRGTMRPESRDKLGQVRCRVVDTLSESMIAAEFWFQRLIIVDVVSEIAFYMSSTWAIPDARPENSSFLTLTLYEGLIQSCKRNENRLLLFSLSSFNVYLLPDFR